jgi:RNA polymerase sigma factor (sigma-70 family)
MTRGQRDSAFYHFHKLLGRRQQIDTPDSQLVDRFAACRDEGAFETLLHRHAGLVWGVCRRMLKDSHLAEDAFQATFLVLAREVSSIRKRQSVGSWLYGVAYRLASRVRSDSTRRQQCEGRMRATNEPDPMTDIIRRELRPVLDEELQALPEKYRAPLILCYLQGKTHEQAAQELGWPVGTMSRRLDKGRDLLRQRLTLRGVTVSATLLTVTLANESTAAIPAGLVATTLRTAILFASGTTAVSALVSASAARLAEGLIKDAAVTKLKIAAVSLIGLVLVTGTGTLVVRAMNGALPQSESRRYGDTILEEPARNQPESSVEPAQVARPMMTTRGRVLDRTGKPVAGAKVYLSEWSPEEPAFQSLSNFKYLLAQTATDTTGTFQLKDSPLTRPGAQLWDLVVVAPDHALAFRPALFEEDRSGSTFVLGPEAKLSGWLVDPDGRPVIGARVDLLAVAGLHDSAVPSRCSAGSLHLSPAQIPIKSKTDRAGKFEIRGVPQDVRLTLMVSHDDFERERIFVATTERKPPDLFDVQGGKILPRRERVYPNGFTHALKAGHRIRGTIVQQDDGLPVPRARVSIEPSDSPAGDAQKYWWDDFSATSDHRGKFMISGFGAGRYTLHVIPPKRSPYLAPYTPLDVRPDTPDQEIAVHLVRGGTIHGKVVDSGTRSGLSSVRVAYNRRVPGRDRAAASVWEKIQAQTGPEGTFSMTLPAGKREIFISEPIPGYATSQNARFPESRTGPMVQTVDIRRGQQIDGVVFALNHSAVAGRVFDPEGNPVAGARVDELGSESKHSCTVTDALGRFVITGDSPSALRFVHSQRRLGALVRDEDLRTKNGELKIHLEPLGLVQGTVVEKDHHPLPGALVQLRYKGRHGASTVANALVTSDGKFEFATMIPGCQYEIEAWANNHTRFHKELGVAGRGQGQDLGDIALHKMDRSIAGRITDDSGAPLADLVLTAAYENQDDRVFMRCDADGRFNVFGLPAGVLRIGALQIAPDDGVVYGPPVKSGRKDVHLVFDRASKKFRK